MRLGRKLALLLLMFLIVSSRLPTIATFDLPTVAHAQEPTPVPSPASSSPVTAPSSGNQALPPAQGGQGETVDKISLIERLALDILQGKQSSAAGRLFEVSGQSARDLVNNGDSGDLFFLDFGNPNLRLNQFAAALARDLLALTPLYVVSYLGLLIYNVWRERPIPNPVLYAGLVLGVMILLAAFGVITEGLGQVGRALALAIGGAGDAMFARATLLDTITRVLANLQNDGGVLATISLIVAMVESAIILIQLAYRGLSMTIWRLLGVLLIPLSVLLEGVQPITAGRVISGFFEAWLDMVGKITLLLIVLSIAASDTFAGSVWFLLPAGLLIVALSWKFLGVLFVMIRDAVARAWSSMVPATAAEAVTPLPAAAEAARAREIDEERKRLLEE
jgi:hypothetical protein